MAVDLFAGISVSDLAKALTWYERLLGAPPTFFPNDVEAVWEIASPTTTPTETRLASAAARPRTSLSRISWLARGVPVDVLDRMAEFERSWHGFVLPPAPHYEGGPRVFSVDQKLLSRKSSTRAGAVSAVCPATGMFQNSARGRHSCR